METAAGNTIQHLAALKSHVRERLVETDIGITANLNKNLNIPREVHTIFKFCEENNTCITKYFEKIQYYKLGIKNTSLFEKHPSFSIILVTV